MPRFSYFTLGLLLNVAAVIFTLPVLNWGGAL